MHTTDSPKHTSGDEKPERPSIINREFVTRIVSAAHGNLRSNRSQAKKAFQVPGPAKSVPVLTGDDSDDSLKHTSCDERPEKPKRPSIIDRQFVTRIVSAAHGNLQSIKSQAKKAFQVLGAAISVPVLPKRTAEIEDTARPRRRLRRPAISLKRLTVNRRYLAWGGGIAGLALVALFLLQSGRKTEGPPAVISPETKDTIVISPPEAVERTSESTAVFSGEKKIEENQKQEVSVSSAEPPAENRQDRGQSATSGAAVPAVTDPAEEKSAPPLEVVHPVPEGRTDQQAAEEKKVSVASVEPPQATAPEKKEPAEQVEGAQSGESGRENPFTPVTVDRPVPKPEAQIPTTPVEAGQTDEPARGQSAASDSTTQVIEEEKKIPEQPVVIAPSFKPEEENVVGADGNRTLPEAYQEKTIAPALVLQAREVVKHRDLLSSAAPVAATQESGQNHEEPGED